MSCLTIAICFRTLLLPPYVFILVNGGQGQKILSRVLDAYSKQDAQVGYCQGKNENII